MRSTTLIEIEESFELKKKDFLTCLVKRSYPQDLVEKVSDDAQFSSRNTALKNKPKSSKKDCAIRQDFQPC